MLPLLCLLLSISLVSAYNAGAAARKSGEICGSSTGNSGCDGSHFGCCTDLTIAALRAGGVNVKQRGAVAQANELKQMGWRTNSTCRGCSPGQVLFYPNMQHVAMCGSGGTRNQWNPSRCGASIYWGEALQCLSAP